MLKPQNTKSRTAWTLEGLWHFKLDENDIGVREKWFESKLQDARMVPSSSSFNELFLSADIKNYFGPFWYQKILKIPYLKKCVIKATSVELICPIKSPSFSSMCHEPI